LTTEVKDKVTIQKSTPIPVQEVTDEMDEAI
jgi:hypothetical protein